MNYYIFFVIHTLENDSSMHTLAITSFDGRMVHMNSIHLPIHLCENKAGEQRLREDEPSTHIRSPAQALEKTMTNKYDFHVLVKLLEHKAVRFPSL